MQGLIDTHFHLDMYKDYKTIYEHLDEEKQYTLCVTTSPGIFLSCKKMFRSSKYVQFALGFHPLNTDLKQKDLTNFMYLLSQTDYVGEIGLDFSKKTGIPRDMQIYYFDKIVEVCSKNNKLMSVHIKEAEEEALQIFNKWKPRRCIVHWYTGSIEKLQEFLKLGCYFSINTNMLNDVEKINMIPKNKILIESDGPYSKICGKKYQPQNLLQVYNLIAKALHEPNLIEIIYSNFKEILTT